MPLKIEEVNSEGVERKKEVFSNKLREKLKDKVACVKGAKTPKEMEAVEKKWMFEDSPVHVPYERWEARELGFDLPEEKEDLPELADADDFDLNNYISAKVMLPKDGFTFASGKVVRRAKDENGELIGKTSHNPLLDSSVYEVEFEDGVVERHHSNIIAEHIHSQIDQDGHGRTLLDEIIDHKSDGRQPRKVMGSAGPRMVHQSQCRPPRVGG